MSLRSGRHSDAASVERPCGAGSRHPETTWCPCPRAQGGPGPDPGGASGEGRHEPQLYRRHRARVPEHSADESREARGRARLSARRPHPPAGGGLRWPPPYSSCFKTKMIALTTMPCCPAKKHMAATTGNISLQVIVAGTSGTDGLVPLTWDFAYPSLIAAGFATVAWIVVWCLRHSITEMIDSPAGRVFFPLLTAGSGLVAGWLIDIIDISELAEGNAQPHLFWTGPLLVLSSALLIACSVAIWFRDQSVLTLKEQRGLFSRIARAGDHRARQVRKVVGKKLKRIENRAAEERQKLSVKTVREALDPEEQLGVILGCLHACMFGNRQTEDDSTLHLVLYLPSADRTSMDHFLSTNGELEGQEKERVAEHAEKFQLPYRPAEPCLVAYTADHGGLHVITDSAKLSEEETKKFHLFYDGQDRKLRSACAFSIEGLSGRPYPVLMAYSDQAGGFSEPIYPDSILSKDLEAFSYRIAFELEMLRFFSMGAPE